MIKAFTTSAWEDFTYWQDLDRKTLKRISNLLRILTETTMMELGNLSHWLVICLGIGVDG